MFYTTDTTEIVICDYCNGDGSIKDYTGDWGTCRECDGEGRVIKQTSVTYKKLPRNGKGNEWWSSRNERRK